MRKLPPLLAAAIIAAAAPTLFAVEKLPPIEKVQIVADHFEVNGKPFFPIMSWLQHANTYPKLHDLGINTQVGSADAKAADDVGDYVVTSPKKGQDHKDRVLAYIHGDEPDMAQKKKPGQTAPDPRTAPEAVIATYKEIKAADDTRPVFVTFTGSFLNVKGDYPDDVRAKLYPQYVTAADVVGFDIYPIYGSGYAAHLNHVGQGVAELRVLAGPKRPVYAWIETSKGSKWMTYEKQPDVLPMHTRNEVWQAIINGATAIGYFTHAWRPDFKEFAPTEDMQKELKRIDAQITALTPAILAGPPNTTITMKLSDNLLCQLKATELAGVTHIFALNEDLGVDAEKAKQFDPIKPHAGKATFNVPGLKAGIAIEVVDENRSLTSQAGSFTDNFEPLAEHIYRFKR